LKKTNSASKFLHIFDLFLFRKQCVLVTTY